MLIYGHRGASGELPENTIAAFRRAIELGVAGIETDLYATADDQIILTHDPSLARTYRDRAGCAGDDPGRNSGIGAGCADVTGVP